MRYEPSYIDSDIDSVIRAVRANVQHERIGSLVSIRDKILAIIVDILEMEKKNALYKALACDMLAALHLHITQGFVKGSNDDAHRTFVKMFEKWKEKFEQI